MAHLSALLRLTLRVSARGPLDPELILALNGEQLGLYNVGGENGLFSAQILGIKPVDSAP
ncbi:unnamed protein product [Gadus morhua 'NCC']